MTQPTHKSTENPPAAAGTDLVEDAVQPAGSTAPAPVVDVVTSTENPPHTHGAAVLDEQAGPGEPVTEAPDQSPLQSGGLHAADVTGLEEHEIG